jgi:hypothetical protein
MRGRQTVRAHTLLRHGRRSRTNRAHLILGVVFVHRSGRFHTRRLLDRRNRLSELRQHGHNGILGIPQLQRPTRRLFRTLVQLLLLLLLLLLQCEVGIGVVPGNGLGDRALAPQIVDGRTGRTVEQVVVGCVDSWRRGSEIDEKKV